VVSALPPFLWPFRDGPPQRDVRTASPSGELAVSTLNELHVRKTPQSWKEESLDLADNHDDAGSHDGIAWCPMARPTEL
jgi:hypothetical protein